MSDDHPSWLIVWLRANLIASIALIITIVSSSGWALVTASRWITTNETQIRANTTDLGTAKGDIKTLQNDIVDVDRRLNAANARMNELHSKSEAADLELKSRLDVIDALAKMTAEHSFQGTLPPPYQPGRSR